MALTNAQAREVIAKAKRQTRKDGRSTWFTKLEAIAERADDEACRKAGIPLYWCEAIGRFVTVPAKED